MIESSWNGQELDSKIDFKPDLPLKMTTVQKKFSDLNLGLEFLSHNPNNTKQLNMAELNCDLPMQAESVVKRNLPVKFETDEKNFE